MWLITMQLLNFLRDLSEVWPKFHTVLTVPTFRHVIFFKLDFLAVAVASLIQSVESLRSE